MTVITTIGTASVASGYSGVGPPSRTAPSTIMVRSGTRRNNHGIESCVATVAAIIAPVVAPTTTLPAPPFDAHIGTTGSNAA